MANRTSAPTDNSNGRKRSGYLLLAAACYLPTLAMPVEGSSATQAVSYEQARATYVRGDFAVAREQFQTLVTRHPDNADYLLGLGQASLALGETKQAIAILERARKLAPDYPDVLQVLASAYRRSGNHAAEQEVRSAAMRIDPDATWLLATGGSVVDRQRGATRDGVVLALTTEATQTEREETWREHTFGAEYAWNRRRLIGFRAARSQRFGRRDSRYFLYGALPLSERLTLSMEAQTSPTHRVRPEWGARAGLSAATGGGWLITLEGARIDYDIGPSDEAAVTLERYFGAYRAAYTYKEVQPSGGPWSPVHRVSGSWYYGDDSRLTLNLALGEETDPSVTGAPAVVFDTWGAGFGGRHWLSDHVGVDYAIGYEGLESDRGNHLDRTTLYAGIALRF